MKVTAQSDAPVPSQYTNQAGNLQFGDGTTTNDHFGEVTDADTGLTLGLREQPRQAPTAYSPTSSSFDGKTLTENYTLPAGAESTSNGSYFNNPNRDATNFDLLVGLNNGSGDNLASFITGDNQGHHNSGVVLIDVTGSTGATLHGMLQYAGNGHFNIVSTDNSHTILIGDNSGDATTTQNSEQGLFFGGSHPLAGDTLDVTLSAYRNISGGSNPHGAGLIEAVHDHITFTAPGTV